MMNLPPGDYEIEIRTVGYLLVGGICPYGLPYEGKRQEWINKYIVHIPEDEYINHGNGD